MTRKTLALVLLLSLVVPLMVQAQPSGKVHRIGLLVTWSRLDPKAPPAYHILLKELDALGYRDGQNALVEWRHTDGQEERRLREAAALAQWKPDVVVTAGNRESYVMLDASPSVPIVCALCSELVEVGLAVSLARPGGNVTGIQTLTPELTGKRLQLMKELVPKLDLLAVFHDTPTRAESVRYLDRVFAILDPLARSLSVRILRFPVTSSADFEGAFAKMSGAGVQAVMVLPSPRMNANKWRIIDLSASHRLPAIHEFKSDVVEGALASYGVNSAEAMRQVARYVVRILKGAKAADLPVEQPTKFELAINLKTAKALGLTVPQSILARADQIIQ